MRILAIVVMFCILLGIGCGKSNYSNNIAAYEISEHDLGIPYDRPGVWHYENVKPLDGQFEAMAKQLIPKSLASKGKEGRVILSSREKKIIKDFQDYFYNELTEEWKITVSAANVDAIVTGVLFNIKAPLDSIFPDTSVDRLALFLFWIVETDLKVKSVLSATDNYENSEITRAIEDLVKDLQDKGRLESKNDWKIALINKSVESEDVELVTAAVLSALVTTTAFEKIVNTETNLAFLYKDDTSKYNSKLQQALWPDKVQKTSEQTDLVKTFSKSTGANAVLIIEQFSTGHFDLKLIDLPSLDLLGIGQSDN